MNPSMTPTNMQVLRSYDGEGNLQRNVEIAAAQEALFNGNGVPAGRCLSLNASGLGELGVTGRRFALWLFRNSTSPSGGWNGESAQTATGITWADGSKKQFLCFVGIEGLEIATTEFIAGGGNTYAFNALISARMTNNVAFADDAARAANAGKIYANGVLHGAHPVVGVVSRPQGTYKQFGMDYVTFYTLYRPPVEGILDGTPTNSVAP